MTSVHDHMLGHHVVYWLQEGTEQTPRMEWNNSHSLAHHGLDFDPSALAAMPDHDGNITTGIDALLDQLHALLNDHVQVNGSSSLGSL